MRGHFKNFLIAFSIILLFASCEHEEKYIPTDFVINQIYNITTTSATIEGTYTSGKPQTEIKALGYTLSESNSDDFGTDSMSIFSDKKSGSIICNITNLKPNTIYYVIPVTMYFRYNMTIWDLPNKQLFETLSN